MEKQDLVLNSLLEIKERLGSIDSTINSVSDKLESLSDDNKETEQRIAKLEDSQKKVKWLAMGAAGVIASVWHIIQTWWIGGNGH